MNLGAGEYLNISNCIDMPYKPLDMKMLMRAIEEEIETVDNIIYFDTAMNSIDYDIVWDGVGVIKSEKFEFDKLIQYPLSALDVKFTNGIVGRIQVSFLDEKSYEVSFITNYTEVFKECRNAEVVISQAIFIEELAYKMFRCFRPLYGVIGIEISCEGLEELRTDKYLLPCDKVYLANKVCNLHLKADISENIFVKDFKDGIYVRYSKIQEYNYVCSDLEKAKLYSYIDLMK